jgi:predicted small lipoprotein YifL
MKTSISTLLLFVLAGCGRGGPSLPPPPTVMPPPFSLYSDNGGGIRDSVREVVRDGRRYAEIWALATSNQNSPPAPPQVEFNRDMVILVGAGRLTPEDRIHVDSLLVRPELTSDGKKVETLTIVVRTIIGCGRFRTDAFPVEIVRARSFDGPVKFDDRKVQSCQGE